MNILAIDPGPKESAFVIYDGKTPTACDICGNGDLLTSLRRESRVETVVIERIESFGMAVGQEVFDTVHWTGRFHERWLGGRRSGRRCCYIGRRDVKLHLCGNARARDPNVRQALIDRFGPGKDVAVGIKAAPGPLYAIKKDMWSALAVAVTWWDKHATEQPHVYVGKVRVSNDGRD